MRILLIGQGAREHALAWKLKQSSLMSELFVWPGNAAMNQIACPFTNAENPTLEELALEAKNKKIDLTICGPETPLANGIKDIWAQQQLLLFGPNREASQLESSKAFAKTLMLEAAIPTAAFTIANSAEECLQQASLVWQKYKGVVLKDDGLAGGKGVFVCHKREELTSAVKKLYPNQGDNKVVVVEELLKGRECSYFALLSEKYSDFLGFAVDFKRAEEGDLGPNTGGMGCYTPVPWLPKNAHSEVQERILDPLQKILKKKKIEFQGFLYIGLMWSSKGPQVVEFNVRLGDPEAQTLAAHDTRDWLALIMQHFDKETTTLGKKQKNVKQTRKTVSIVMASKDYPNPPNQSPKTQSGNTPLSRSVFQEQDTINVFGAAITGKNDRIFPGCGRVLTVVSTEESFNKAREKALEQCREIASSWPEGRWRNDIAQLVATEEDETTNI